MPARRPDRRPAAAQLGEGRAHQRTAQPARQVQERAAVRRRAGRRVRSADGCTDQPETAARMGHLGRAAVVALESQCRQHAI